MVNFKKLLGVLLFIHVSNFADDIPKETWVPIPGYSLWELYTYGGIDQKEIKRETKIVSSSGLSWPDGRQALITYVEVIQGKQKWLYRCVDSTNKDFQSTGQLCYELRDPRRK